MTVLSMLPGYFDKAFDAPEQLIEDTRRALASVDYDTFVGIGLSGALVVPMLARALNKHFLLVRKMDGSHSINRCEGRLGNRWVFVDDFVSTGKSCRNARDAVAHLCLQSDHSSLLMGIYEYTLRLPEDTGSFGSGLYTCATRLTFHSEVLR